MKVRHQRTLGTDLGVSGEGFFLGYFAAVVIGIPVGIAVGWYRTVAAARPTKVALGAGLAGEWLRGCA